MFKREYHKIINNMLLAEKKKEEIKSQNDFILIGFLEANNKVDFTEFTLKFKNDTLEKMYKDKVKTNFKFKEIPNNFMIVNEIGIRTREYDNVKYYDYAGDVLFSYGWCE